MRFTWVGYVWALDKRKELEDELRTFIPYMTVIDNDPPGPGPFRQVRLGSFEFLDPCGKKHDLRNKDDIPEECAIFWRELKLVVKGLGGWLNIERGETSSVYFCLPFNDQTQEEQDNE